MECMEEGYLAKIICGDGAKEIKVGEVLIFLFTFCPCENLRGKGMIVVLHHCHR